MVAILVLMHVFMISMTWFVCCVARFVCVRFASIKAETDYNETKQGDDFGFQGVFI